MSKREATGRRYRKLVARLRSLGLPCWICGKDIGYHLPAGDPLSFEYDHYYPASRWREFGYASQSECVHDPSNGRPSHRLCNERRQASMPWEKGWAKAAGAVAAPPGKPKKRSRAD